MNKKIEKVLRDIEAISDREHFYWNVPRTTGDFLNMLAKAVRARTVLEIGTSNGYSGLFFADAVRETGGQLFTVESHRGRYQEARGNFEKAEVMDAVTQIYGHAPEIFAEMFEKKRLSQPLFQPQAAGREPFPPMFDMIFIDATKMEYASYFEVLFDRLSPGGLLIADNAVSHGREMHAYLQAVTCHPNLQSVLLPFDNGLMLSYKKMVAESL